MATFVGQEYGGQYRCAGSFVEGRDTRMVIISGADLLVLDYTGQNVIHREPHRLPGEYYTRSIACSRSPNSGNLVLTLGGFLINVEAGQRPALISTSYHTRRPDPGPD